MKETGRKALWMTLRMILFTAFAVLIFIFPDFFTNHAAFVIGAVMILFAADDLIRILLHGGTMFPTGVVSFSSVFLAVLMMVFLHSTKTNIEHLIKVGTVFAVWSILQECFDLYEMYCLFRKNRLGIIGAAESAAIIVLSVFLIIDPEAHLRLHIIILGVELVLKYAFPVFYDLLSRRKTGSGDRTTV